MRIKQFRNLIWIGVVFNLISGVAFSQLIFQTGVKPLEHYSPKDYRGKAQNWAAVQDTMGRMFFGNNEGLLEFDGTKWKMHHLQNESEVRTLFQSSSGRIYVGGRNEIGYLKVLDNGISQYETLIAPDNPWDFEEIWEIHEIGEDLYFQSANKIIWRKNGSFSPIKAANSIICSWVVNETLLVTIKNLGLCAVKNGSFEVISDDEVFHTLHIYESLKINKNTFLVVTNTEGIVNLKFDSDMKSVEIVKSEHPVNGFRKFGSFYKSSVISQNRMAIPIWGLGCLIVDSNQVLEVIDEKSGLVDLKLNFVYEDREGLIWLMSSNGISCFYNNYQISHFGKNLNVSGTVEQVLPMWGRVYIVSALGLLYLPSSSDWVNAEINDEIHASARTVKNLEYQSWGIDKVKYKNQDHLVVAMDDGIYLLDSLHNSRLLAKGYVWNSMQSSQLPDYLFTGTSEGLFFKDLNEQKVGFTGSVDSVNYEIRMLVEDGTGRMWGGSDNNLMVIGPFKSDMSNNDISSLQPFVLGPEQQFPDSSHGYPFYLHSSLHIATKNGIYKSNENGTNLSFDEDINKEINFPSAHRLASSENNGLWVVSYDNNLFEFGKLRNVNGVYNWSFKPFAELSENLQHSVASDSWGNTWVGGTHGLYKIENKDNEDYGFQCFISSFSYGRDSVKNFVSAWGKDQLEIILGYSMNSVSLNYSSNTYRFPKEVKYTSLLEGFETEWSESSSKTERFFTNLYEGEYTFRVKAETKLGEICSETSFSFVVLPPWYRTWWSITLYGILLVVLIIFIVKWNTRRLVEDKKRLEEIVEQRTAEIRRQKDEVEKQKVQIEEQKLKLSDTLDELHDSINYAERIQKALLLPEEHINKSIPDHFILFRPKDVVSGDYYWATIKENHLFLTAADCTGHGVPGAFMSMLGMSFLNEISNNNELLLPSEILTLQRANIMRSLGQGKHGNNKDGMDMALLRIELDQKDEMVSIDFSGANNPLWIVVNTDFVFENEEEYKVFHEEGNSFKLVEIKADKMPVGYYVEEQGEFNNHRISVPRGAMLYAFSDGYADQFGGEKGKKFMYKSFKRLLVEVSSLNMDDQKNTLTQRFVDWMGTENEQIDDVVVIGLRV